mmetsp:Transcript_13548/g.25545  ORF Transcript_13548/g.25545 Transcript_13548/m.25545 type:complete len:400 (+) Transcript_13548:819-2018(+)
MYYVGKGCGKCCAKCCDGCCSCLSECFNCLGKLCECCNCKELCQRPFCGCTTFNFFVMALPFVAGVTWGECSMTNIHLLIQGILMLINFLICVYLMVKLSKDNPEKKEGPNDTWSKVKHLICYDFVVCSYVFVLIFEFIWNILGHVWLADPGCSSSLEAMDYAAIIIMWVWLSLSAMLFCCSVTVAACDDGSCGVDTCLRDCFYCLCCCCLCSSPSTAKEERRSKTLEQYQAQPESKPKFISSAFSMLGAFGIFSSKKKPPQTSERSEVQLRAHEQQQDKRPPPDPRRLNDISHPPPDPVSVQQPRHAIPDQPSHNLQPYDQPHQYPQTTHQQPQPYYMPQQYQPQPYQQPQTNQQPSPYQPQAYPPQDPPMAREQGESSQDKSIFTKAKEKVENFFKS